MCWLLGKSCGKNPTPEFAGNYTASLSRGDFDYILGLRFLGETEDLNTVDIDIEDKTYLDFTVNYQFNDNLRFSVGAVTLDEDPVIHQVLVLLQVMVILDT